MSTISAVGCGGPSASTQRTSMYPSRRPPVSSQFSTPGSDGAMTIRHDPSGAFAVPAHITLLGPFLLVAELDAGVLKPIVSKVFGLDELGQAYAALATGRTRGKVVIDVRTLGAR